MVCLEISRNFRMRPLFALLASASAVCAIAGSAAAAAPQADTIDLNVPTQLPRTAIPHHYAITLTPHADALTFDGNVAIDVEVTKPTTNLVLNAANLSFAKVTL